jgi:fused signal recognition particle receptor
MQKQALGKGLGALIPDLSTLDDREKKALGITEIELDKIKRIAAREVPGAPQEVLLVLDATVGQNGVTQAREFTNVAGVNGIVLTKLDGTAKGGVAVAIANDLKLPIRYVGVGEGIEDLVRFSADEYVDGLFEEKW